MSTHSRIDTTLYLSAAAAVILALAAVGWRAASPRSHPEYGIGMRFDKVPGVDFGTAPATLIVWMNSQCGACTASTPFYRRLTSDVHRVRVIAMGREPVDSLRGYMEEHGVQPTDVVSVGNQPLAFAGTPTLVLVGADSLVRSVWFGKRQTLADEEAVIWEINTGPTEGRRQSDRHTR